VNEVPAYPIERANVEVGNKGAVMGRVRERAGEEGEVTTLDGARVDTEEGWFLVRASGTQPLIRLTAEARSADRAESLLRSARDLVETARD
jgi:phosphoglucosamine mutase